MDGILIVDGQEVLVRDIQALDNPVSSQLAEVLTQIYLRGRPYRAVPAGCRLQREGGGTTHPHGIMRAMPVYVALRIAEKAAPEQVPTETPPPETSTETPPPETSTETAPAEPEPTPVDDSMLRNTPK
jgi:hypothetical protein